jgi:hypothetical protein
MMSVAPWKILTWPAVPVLLEDWPRNVRKLRHLGMSVHVDDGGSRLGYGQVLWGLETECGMLGMAWDWRELVKGVVVMADPMSIVTNGRLVDEEGEMVSEPERLLCLNTAVYRLPWQPVVASTKRRLREEVVAYAA